MTQVAHKPAALDPADELQRAGAEFQQVIAAKPESDHLLAELVRIASRALRAAGAGVWVTEHPEKPELIIEQHLPALQILVEGVTAKGITTGVRRCAREAKPLIVPPMFTGEDALDAGDSPSNPTPLELMFMPVRLQQKVGMVLMLAVPPASESDTSRHRAYLNFLAAQIAALEETLAQRHLSLVEKDRGHSNKLMRFAEQVHKHLFLGEVAADVSNLARDVLEAQRVTVEFYPKRKKRITAVSNVDEPSKRSTTAQVQRLIFDYVRDRHVPVAIDREAAKQLASDPALQDAAQAYFLACEFDAFIAAPIKTAEPASPVLGVILAEYSKTESAQANTTLLAEITRLCTGATTNAMDVESLPLIKPYYTIRKFLKKRSSKRTAALFITVLAALLGMFIFLVPFDHSVKADCQVRPSAQLSIVAPLTERIISVPVRAGEHVYPKGVTGKNGEPAKPLAVFDSIELVSKRAEAIGKLAQFQVEQKEWEKKGDMGKIASLQNQIEQAQNEIQRIDHEIEQCTVWSPIEGTILTENVEQKQYSTPRQGEELMDVASFSDFELVVDVPESEVADVRAALEKATTRARIDGTPDRGIEVEYILYPWPDTRYEIRARGVATLLPASQQTKSANVFRLQVKLEPGSLPPGLSMSGVTGRAKVHVGKQALAGQLTRGLTRLLRMTVFF